MRRPPFRLCVSASALMLSAFLVGCLARGFVTVGLPRVYDSETTAAKLQKSGGSIGEKLRKDLDLKAVQEAFAAAETEAISARAGAAGAGGTAAVPTPSAVTTVKAEVPSVTLGATLEEQIRDVVRAEMRTVSIELLFSAAGKPSSFGADARVYLVDFDLGLFPTRQSRLLYPWWAIVSGFGGVYNFTRGWSLEVAFLLPQYPRRNATTPAIFVYDVIPRTEVVTALEKVTNAVQRQLAASYATPAAAVQLDYLNRLEEQFLQQRRYPLQMGVFGGWGAFGWIFGPRRQIKKRNLLVRSIPGVADYSIDSRLEPGMRTGSVILVVPDAAQLDPTPGIADLRARLDQRWGEQWRGVFEEGAPSAAVRDAATHVCQGPADAWNIPVAVVASYLDVSRPNQAKYVPIYGPDGIKPGITAICLSLPKAGPLKGKVKLDLAEGEKEDTFQVKLQLAGADFTCEKPRAVRVQRPDGKIVLSTRSIAVPGDAKDTVVATIDKPVAPLDGGAEGLQLVAILSTDEGTYPASQPITYALGAAPNPARIVPAHAAPGERVSLQLGKSLALKVDQIDYLAFGTQVVKASDPGWEIHGELRRASFAVPIPKKGESAGVDVVVFWKKGKDGKVPGPVRAGRFSYEPAEEAKVPARKGTVRGE